MAHNHSIGLSALLTRSFAAADCAPDIMWSNILSDAPTMAYRKFVRVSACSARPSTISWMIALARVSRP
jgi:hypothetical protein